MALSGCAQVWDDATAVHPEGGFRNNLAFRSQLLFDRPDPLIVLRDSSDGDMRARAYRALRYRYDGGPEENKLVLEVLATGAREEKQTLCRLAAIETLGYVKDPLASKALADAFYAPINFSDKNPVVRMEALKSLAKIGDPSAVETLAEAVRRDPSLDVRVAAADALGRFQNNYQATQALVRTLKEEKDVALCQEATASLRQITGKDYPAKAEAWETYLQQAAPATAQKANQPSILPAEFRKNE